jgi:hypothetical protein
MPARKTNTYRKNTGYKTGYKTTGYKTSYNRTARPTTTCTTTYACTSPKFRGVRQECQWRIGSYWNVYSQFTGVARNTIFSPTTANKWMRYVNSGVQVYKFNQRDFTRFFGAKWANNTPTATRKYLANKYGTTIKDAARGNNCWLIAASRTPTARPFTNYTWK